MKQQISGPMGAVILVIIVVIIAAIGWSMFKGPTNNGPTDAQRAAYQKSGGKNSAEYQKGMAAMAARTGQQMPSAPANGGAAHAAGGTAPAAGH